MAPSSPRHPLSPAAVVLLLASAGSGGCGPARHAQPPVIPWTGCSTAEHPPSGLLEPETPIGSIDATSSWRALARAGAPPPLAYKLVWTARGLALLALDGSGALYNPYEDAWRAVPAQRVRIPSTAFVAGGSILFAEIGTRDPPPRAFDLASAAWRALPPPPEGVGTGSAYAWTGSALFLWGGLTGRSPAEDSGLGGILDMATGTWRPVAREGAPTARTDPVVVWTGSVFFVWGGASKENGSGRRCHGGHDGFESDCVYHADGAIYDPLQDRWHEVPAHGDGVPPPLVRPGLLWTGRVLLLWEEAQPSTVLYAYDPFACRWRAPMVKPASLGGSAGMSGGRAVFVGPDGGDTLDVDRGTFARFTLPEDLRACRHNQQSQFEPSRVIVISPAICHQGTIAVSAFDPVKNTWKTAVLPPVPPPTTLPGARGPFSGTLVWTGEHLVAWGGAYETSDRGPTGCESPPPGMGCDPVGPPMHATNEGYIIRPSL